MSEKQPTPSDIPPALYGCSNRFCAQEVSYPAEDLFWFADERRWVCENCWDNLLIGEDEEPARGISLAAFLASQNAHHIADANKKVR